MKKTINTTLSATLLLTLAACAPTVTAQNAPAATPATAPAAAKPADAKPTVQVAASVVNTPIVSGSTVTISGKGFVPGSKINVKYEGGTNLTAGTPYTVAADGSFSGSLVLPAGATLGSHVLNVLGSEHQMVEAKVTVVNDPKVPLSGADLYSVTSSKLAPGLYQVDYSAKNKVLWVTSAVGRQANPSALLKVDPQSLKVLQSYDVLQAVAPDGTKGAAVYGISVDDTKDTVWVTNTRSDATSVYSQADGKLLKVISYPKSATHELKVDGAAGKAIVANASTNDVSIIDTTSYAMTNVKLSDGGSVATGVALDPAKGLAYVTDMGKNTLAVIDYKNNKLVATYPVGSVGATRVDIDAAAGKAYVTSQQSADMTVMDLNDGHVIAHVETGVGALGVSVDPAGHRAYVSNRGSGTVTVVNTDTNKVVANLNIGSYPNHQVVVGGVLYEVNKSLSADDASGDMLTRIALK